jgi:SulP family sulfate permease
VQLPKIVSSLKGYTRRQAADDIIAGIIVGIVALPLAIAFAIASGLPPERGLFTAIIAGFLISLLGGSRVQIGGPTGAFVVIVYGIVQQHGVAGLTVATLMAGAILVLLGIARLGTAIRFIPFPVTLGFTSGIALVIFSSQIPDLLGLQLGGPAPAEFIEKWSAYAHHIQTVNLHAALVAGISLTIVLLWPRVSRRIPGPFVAILIGTLTAVVLGLDVETIGSRFGSIPTNLPKPQIPGLALSDLRDLVAPAFAIAMLGAIESLLSAVIADGMISGKHRPNAELVAQGVANIVAPLFGGMPATGAIARTATNIKNGGRTPIAGITHAITLALITMFFGRWVEYIPMATLAAILVVVAYHMSEWRTFRSEFGAPKSDIMVLLATFILTVLVDLTVAIQVGMVLAMFLFMKRMSEVTNINAVTAEYVEEIGPARGSGAPPGVLVYEINGPFFFGAAEKFKETMGTIAKPPRVLIVRMRHVMAMDTTGMHAFRDLIRRSRKDGTQVLLAEIRSQPLVAMDRRGLLDEVGEENLFGTVEEAIEAARPLLEKDAKGAA